MLSRKICVAVCLVILCTALSAAGQSPASVQKENPTNIDTQLYLIFATNREAEGTGLPPALQSTVARLREALGFKSYTLAASFLNRVKDNGRLQ